MTAVCPDCYVEVHVSPNAREGRCDSCRPRRRHSGGKKHGNRQTNWTSDAHEEFVNGEWRLRRTFLGLNP